MKKLIPYILSLALGIIFGIIIFKNGESTILKVFNEKQEIEATAFQLGVFNDISLAKKYKEKYPSSILMTDDDVYRLYYSILTNDKVINKMETFLNENKISYYKKNIIITDKSLITALKTYEENMLDISNNITFESLNNLIMESYGGNI